MTVDGEYFRHGENLQLPIQIPLSKKSKTLCWSFIAFLKSTLIFEHFEKMSLIAQVFLKLLWLLKCIKGPASENTSVVDVLMNPKNCWKLQKSNFILLFLLVWTKLSQKKSFLVRSEILGLHVNKLTANGEYFRHNRENLPLPIQIQLFKKPKKFWCFII